MPRPKVKPQDRRRSVVACIPCKAAKIRCDSRSPCRACVKRGRHATCSYAGALRAHLRDEVLAALDEPSQDDEQETIVVESSPSDRHSGAGSTGPGMASIPSMPAQPQPPLDGQTAWEPNSRITQIRTMLSSRGEKVYLGPISTLSLLHFLRQVLKSCIGPTPFTETDSSNVMLEEDLDQAPVDTIPGPSTLSSGDVHRYQHYIRVFCEATSGLLYLYTEDDMQCCFQEYKSGDSPLPSVDSSVTMAGRDKVKRHRLAAAYLMIAVGGQCQGSTEASAFFLKGQQIAFEGFLYDPSLDQVKEFLLMAYYTLAGGRRNAAFMYLGVASKAASALGLHRREQYRACSTQEANARLRCWQSLRVLDTLVNSLLGRAGSTMSTRPDVDCLEHSNHDESDAKSEPPRKVAIDTGYKICRIIDEIDAELFKSNKVAVGPSEANLQRLRQLGQHLPPALRQFTINEKRELRDPIDQSCPISSSERERVIGAVHVACSYYFAIILGTRPFLISHVMSRLQNYRTNVPHGSNTGTMTYSQQREQSTENAKTSEDVKSMRMLAQACVESSVYMAQLCAKAMQNDLLYDTMCMIQGLVFVAGLLIGFSLLVQDNKNSETILSPEAESGLHGACHVLQRFARLNAEAQHHHRVLVNFSEAIRTYKQRLMSDVKKGVSNQYIDPVFVIDDGSTAATPTFDARLATTTECGNVQHAGRAVDSWSSVSSSDVASSTTYLSGSFFGTSAHGADYGIGVCAGGDVDVAITNGTLPEPYSWVNVLSNYADLPPGLFFEDF